MYYHCRPLKYAEYGKIFPPPLEARNFLSSAYNWLGYYCGYSPQVWLARSKLSITGYKKERIIKKNIMLLRYERKRTQEQLDSVLFGFETIKGFPVAYDPWDYIRYLLYTDKDMTLEEQNKKITKELNESLDDAKKDGDLYPDIIAWEQCNRDLDLFLRKHVFIESDQVVVPSLNLKAAKQIICRNERQKKTLRRMGFIEDRIVIKNIKPHS